MKHLTSAQLIDVVERTARPGELAHVSACDSCRSRAEELRASMALAETTGAADVPEPSPLFWDHLSARVKDAISSEPERTPSSFLLGDWRFRFAAAGLTVVVGVAIATAPRWLWTDRLPETSGSATRSEAPAAPGDADDVEGGLALEQSDEPDTPWLLMANLSSQVDWDAAGEAGIVLRPGTAEHAVLHLSQDERRELTRLLKAELNRPES